MPAIRDKERKTWTAQFYYVDYSGERKRKRKRGFKYKKDALKWEREFLAKQATDLNMPFERFSYLYLDDCKNRLRESSCKLKEFLLETKILPYFGQKRVLEITPLHIRDWQNELLAYRNENGKPYSQTYLRSINDLLTSIFNYAVKFFNLKTNPCITAGNIGSEKAHSFKIWTIDQFQKFLNALGDSNPPHKMALTIMFFTGLRVGEVLALTCEDIDMNNCIISVTKTYKRYKKQDFIGPPKTEKSIREVSIPEFLRDQLSNYIYEFSFDDHERIFSFTSSALRYTIRKYAQKAGIEPIRLHDFRHSHVSLLINLGFNPKIVADRLGHSRIRTTLDIYSHLYPYINAEVAQKLNELAPK